MDPFESFASIPRLSRDMVVTEKIDGTNAQILIDDVGDNLIAGSRSRWITPEDDNFGFARWVQDHKAELLKLGPGRHYGEWWGAGVQRRYGLKEKRFSLFNTARWGDDRDPVKFPGERPACCHVVPTLYRGPFDTAKVEEVLAALKQTGSHASPGFMDPEGVVVWHDAAQVFFKKTFDDAHKGAR